MSLSYLRQAFGAGSALALLNLGLTFQAIWPTWWIRPALAFSVELACLVLVSALYMEWRGTLRAGLQRLMTFILVCMVLGHYSEVMAASLFGRSLHLYWDSQHLPQVIGMLADALPAWKLAAAVFGVISVLAALAIVLSWTVRVLLSSLTDTLVRRGVAVVTAALIVVFTIGGQDFGGRSWFATPLTPLLIHQVNLLSEAVFTPTSLATAGAEVDADLGRLRGTDVYVIFLESYGATVFQEPAYAQALAPDFKALAQQLHASGWRVASALLDSPTFGGGSWLAHASLLAGIRIASEADYRLLLESRQETLVRRFQAAGYRAVALFPGLKQDWPEGRFYGFDRIADAQALDYRGPAIGWWVIPDQYSLYKLHRDEVAPTGRAPLFVCFATIMSHMPFAPTPPYQPDWSRLQSARPFAEDALAAALRDEPRWTDLQDPYLRSIRYELRVIAGYLGELAPQNAVFLILGDHQPLASVSGLHASWSVPVHLITRDKGLLDAFVAAGFREGVMPQGSPLGGIHRLHGLLLSAFSTPPAAAGRR